MTIEKKVIKKTLEKKLVQLNDIIADIDNLLTQMQTDFFRVSVFGSARITPDSAQFDQVYRLAYELSLRGVDIVTGGGPGLMQAANKGAQAGSQKSRSIGLPIDLPFENSPNAHLDVKRQHRRFSTRLDEFMRISHAVVVTPGGIGTILELFYTWQLIQVKHIKKRPIILLGGESMWEELLDWVHRWPVRLNLMSENDISYLKMCASVTDAVACLEPYIEKFYKRP